MTPHLRQSFRRMPSDDAVRVTSKPEGDMVTKNWEFRVNEREAWYWRVSDEQNGRVEQAQHDFGTLFACVRDAERHGYAMPCARDAWYGVPV